MTSVRTYLQSPVYLHRKNKNGCCNFFIIHLNYKSVYIHGICHIRFVGMVPSILCIFVFGIVLHGICYEGRGQDSNTTRGAVDPVL